MSVSANSAAASRPRSSDAARQSRTSNFKVTSRPKPPQTHNSSEWVHLNADPLLTSPTSAHFQTTSPTELEDVPTARSGISLSLSSPNTSALRPQEDDISGSEFAGVIDTDRISVRYDAQGRRMVNQYVRMDSLGWGTHGRVWLCREYDSETNSLGDAFAMKEVYREDQSRNLKKAQRAMHGTSFNHVADAAFQQTQQPVPPTSGRASDEVRENMYQSGSGIQTPERISLPRSHGRISDLAYATPQDAPTQPMKQKRGTLQMEEKVRQEIAIMKRCRHKHIVQLREVINDPKSKKIFMILEYLAGGQVQYTEPGTDGEPIMTVDEARCTIRDVVLGLEYLHYQGIIHRDIKPANLLWTDKLHTCLKITDFGVSHLSEALARDGQTAPTDGALKKTAGSPAFFAPELCFSSDFSPLVTPHNATTPNEKAFGGDMGGYFATAGLEGSSSRPGPRLGKSSRGLSSTTIATVSHPVKTPEALKPEDHAKRKKTTPPPIGKAIDIWALGVTLYCLLFGTTPFHAETEYMLYNIIPTTEAPIPDRMGKDGLSMESDEGREVIDLLGRLLEKDPLRRISLAEVKTHPWILRNIKHPEEWVSSTDPSSAPAVTVTTEDVEHATIARARGSMRGFNPLTWTYWKKGKSRLANVVGFSRPSRRPSASGVSNRPKSATTSRQASGSSQGYRPTSPDGAAGAGRRNWSMRRKAGAGAGATVSASVPTTPLMMSNNPLQRSLSGSSSASNANSSAPASRRPSGQSITVSASSRALPIVLRRANSHMDPSPQSGSSFPAGISSQSDAEAGGKMSLRHVWDKLVSVGRSPSTGSARAHHSLPPDARGHQQSEDTDASVDSQSLAESEGGSMQDPDPALREQFDRLGRRQKPVHHSHEDLSDDALSSDSDSSLGEPIHGDFTYNAGEGWKASDHSMNPDQQQQQQQSHNEDALATPRSLTRAPSSLPGEAGGPRYSHPVYGQADEGAAHLQHSSSDLDTEEEAAALELNFSRRRRHTNPADMNM